MKKSLILSFAIAAAMAFGNMSLSAQVPAPQTGGMPGIAVAGSQNYSSLPEKARKFVDKHFKGATVTKCEQYFVKGLYGVELSNGVDLEFNTKGEVMEIDAPDNSYLAASVVKEVLPHRAYRNLEKKGLVDQVESVEFSKGKAVEVELGINGPDTYLYDVDGNLLIIEE